MSDNVSPAVRSTTLVCGQPPPADRCPKCGGLDWYQVGNLRCCFACAEGFIVASGEPHTETSSATRGEKP